MILVIFNLLTAQPLTTRLVSSVQEARWTELIRVEMPHTSTAGQKFPSQWKLAVQLSKIPDPLCSLPEAGFPPHCIGHLEAVAGGTTSSDAIYHWLGELLVQSQSCLT